MNKFPAILMAAAVLSAAQAPAQSFELLQEVETSFSGGQKLQIATKVKDHMMRMDVAGISTVFDAKTGDILTLMPGQKLFLKIPGGVLEKLAMSDSSANGGKISENDLTLAPTGRKENISGFSCEEHTGIVDGAPLALWITKDQRFVEMYRGYLQRADALQNETDPLRSLWSKLAGVEGLPVRIHYDGGAAGQIRATILSIKEAKFDDSEFQPPPDYRSLQIPDGMEDMIKSLPGGP